MAKYAIKYVPKTRKAVKQHSVIEVKCQKCWNEATLYCEIHPKFICIWEGNSILSQCCEKVWRNYFKWKPEVLVKMLLMYSDLCNSLCHYGLLNIIIKGANLLRNIPHHKSGKNYCSYNRTWYHYICASYKVIIDRIIRWIDSLLESGVLNYKSVYCYTGGNVKKMPHKGQGAGEEKVALLGVQKIPGDSMLFCSWRVKFTA